MAIADLVRMPPSGSNRIVVELDDHASQRQYRELGAFVRFCVFRLEREFGQLRWLVRILATGGEFSCFVAVQITNHVVEARGRGFDGALAAWDALSNVEQGLRETRRREGLGERDHVSDIASNS
jgi:hypothetical protein